MAVTVVLTVLPCCKKLKNVDFTKRLEAATKERLFLKIQSQLETFHLNTFLYVLKKHLCKEKNEREIPSIGTIFVWSIVVFCLRGLLG